MDVRKNILKRFTIIYSLVLVLGISIIARVVYIQFVEGEKWRNKANTITKKDIIIPANRGDICADDFRVLATSVPYYEIRMDLKADGLTDEIFYKNIDSLSFCLSNYFKDKSENQYLRELTNARKQKKRYHLVVNKKINFNELKEVKKFPIFRRGSFKGGFIKKQINKRMLPHKNLASRTIGYLSNSEIGNIVGIEGAYNEELKGKEGLSLSQKLSGGIWMPLKDKNEVEPKDGNDVITTINIDFQDISEIALLKQLKKHKADHGTVILMEVETGEIKAIANLTRNEKTNEYYETYNYAIGESVEPGSTFKLVSLLIALEDGYVNLEDSIETGKGIIHYYGKPLRDSKYGGHGKITVQKVFEVSSNVGISKIITESYKGNENKFIDKIYSMNLNEKTGIKIKGEKKPYIKYPDDALWSGITLPMMSIGYEVKLTPLQILNFYNTVANNGIMLRPKFVKSLRFRGEIIKEFDTEIINKSICSYSTIKKLKKILLGVVERGTAKNIKSNSYKIAGKTGTTQVANRKLGYHGINNKKTYRASFAGYFPADKPKYSCIVVIHEPSNWSYYGSSVAAPVFREIADKVFDRKNKKNIEKNEKKNIKKVPYSKIGYKEDLDFVFNELDIPTKIKNIKSNWIYPANGVENIIYYNRYMMKNKVPNVVGMGIKDALFILENIGFKVKINGKGKIVKQSLKHGKKFKEGMEIELFLKYKN